jgi:glycosyltransferase involved in cell wall biosynthesis
MQRLAAELDVGEWVTLVDPPADVPAELAAAQFAVHPSHTEGLSNAILEQLAHGLPVIACRVGGNPQLIADGVNGLLVPPADPAALAAAIATVTTDPELRTRMAHAARTAATRYDWAACTQAHLALYRTLTGEAA